MSHDLTPGNPAPLPFLTVIPRRVPRDKTHDSRANAHRALSYHVHTRRRWTRERGYEGPALTTGAAALYELVDGAWRLVWSCQPGEELSSATPWKEAE